MEISFILSGHTETRERLARMEAATADLGPALLRSGLVVLKSAQERIDAGGPGWPANYTHTPLLHHTGRLLASLTVGGSDNATDIRENTITVGTNVEYASWLQNGTGIYGEHGEPIAPINAKSLHWIDQNGGEWFAKSVKGVPPRPFLFIDDAIAQTVRDIFAKHIMGE